MKLHPSDTGKFGLLCARDADFSLIVPHQSSDPEEGGRDEGKYQIDILKQTKLKAAQGLKKRCLVLRH